MDGGEVEPGARDDAELLFIVRDAAVRRMAMIHYSPRYTDRELDKLLEEARTVYPQAELSRDRMHFDIPYRNE